MKDLSDVGKKTSHMSKRKRSFGVFRFLRLNLVNQTKLTPLKYILFSARASSIEKIAVGVTLNDYITRYQKLKMI